MNEQEPSRFSTDSSRNQEEYRRHYDKLYEESEGPIFREGKAEEIVEQAAELVGTGAALDIGAGDGRHSIYLANKGFAVTAVDFSAEGIKKLRQYAAEKNLNITVHTADVEDFEWKQDYDVIVISFMLHHLPREAALRLIEISKQPTKLGGVNAIIAFTPEGDFHRRDRELDRYYPNQSELKALFTDWHIITLNEEKEIPARSMNEDGSPMVNTAVRLLAQRPKE